MPYAIRMLMSLVSAVALRLSACTSNKVELSRAAMASFTKRVLCRPQSQASQAASGTLTSTARHVCSNLQRSACVSGSTGQSAAGMP